MEENQKILPEIKKRALLRKIQDWADEAYKTNINVPNAARSKINERLFIMSTSDLPLVSSYDPNLVKSERACGNTTRIVNRVIDELFKGNVVLLLDHYTDGKNSTEAIGSERVMLKVKQRYEAENSRWVYAKKQALVFFRDRYSMLYHAYIFNY